MRHLIAMGLKRGNIVRTPFGYKNVTTKPNMLSLHRGGGAIRKLTSGGAARKLLTDTQFKEKESKIKVIKKK